MDAKQQRLWIETAVGGKYSLPDGRRFWIDAPIAREITERVMSAIGQNGDRALIDAATEALDTMDFVEVFVTSRQKIKKPEGEDMYRDHKKNLADALATYNA